jgi:hypothetical protein
MLFSSQEVSTSTSETPNIVQGLETKRYGYKTITYILYPNCASTCTLMQKKKKIYRLPFTLLFLFKKNVTKSKLIPPNILSIEVLNSHRTGQLLIGDIMVVYSTYLDKANKIRCIMHANMTNNEAMITVTLTIPTQLVQKHAKKILPGNGISITNFNILLKIVYDHGDCDQIILFNETSVVEKFLMVCLEYHFVPNTTINQFVENNDIYPIGTIGAVVTFARKVGSQHILHIKHGNSDNDKAMVLFSIPFFFVLCFDMLISLRHFTQLLNCSMVQLC